MPPALALFARQAFERKFGTGAGIWFDRFEVNGNSVIIYYGYIDVDKMEIGQFSTQIPINLK